MLKKLLTVTTALAIFFAANSQDSTKGTTTMTYSVDAYYRYDFAGKGNNITSFTNSINSFELGMASVRADHSFGKVGATLDLGFGRRAEEFSYNDGKGFAPLAGSNSMTTLAAVKQAYISYQATSKLKFTIGKWATHVGWELLDAYANRNYSMSYGFSNGPFFHTGLKADISLGGKSALMVGVANSTDFTTLSAGAYTPSSGIVSGNKIAIAQFSTGSKDDKVKAYLNFQGGTDAIGDKLTQEDLVLNFVLNGKWGLNYDGTIQSFKSVGGTSHSWTSNAVYLNFDPSSKLGWTLRAEYFDDKDNVRALGVGNVFAATLSANYKVGNLTLIPELRLDNAKNEVFLKSSNSTGIPDAKSAASFILAAAYKF